MNPYNELTNKEEYNFVCSIKDLKNEEGKRFIIDDTEIAVFKVNGEVYALNNICAHQHTALIYDGFIEDGCVVCPVHGWMFDLQTGRMPTNRKGIDAYPVAIDNDKIYVKITKKELKW